VGGAILAMGLAVAACGGASGGTGPRQLALGSVGQHAAATTALKTVPSSLRRWPAHKSPACPSGGITVGCWYSPQRPIAAARLIRRSIVGAGFNAPTVTCVSPNLYCVVRTRGESSLFTYRIERLHRGTNPGVRSWTGLKRGDRVWLVAVSI
jgi:hypothetical protein